MEVEAKIALISVQCRVVAQDLEFPVLYRVSTEYKPRFLFFSHYKTKYDAII